MYDFTSLSSYDFELLVRDLLQKHLRVTLESFKSGRDKGIDLRYAPVPAKSLIVQCKHYAGTGFSGLLTALKGEVLKVNRLGPARYILATSVPLTPKQKDDIVVLLSPHCKSSGDIIGCEDINNLLTNYPEVERAHYKLWLTSTVVLDRMLHSRLYEQSRLTVEDIRQKVRLYVQNDSYFEAQKLLSTEHYCIISGVPGIGKTFLAEVLLVHHIDQGYEPFVVNSHISEAYEVLNREKKQVFYYDDFLGQTGLVEKLQKNEDISLLRFINHVTLYKGVRFILTTREYILQSAKQFYERLDSSDFDDAKCVIELEKYTRLNRAQILYNHLYFSALPDSFRAEICKRKSLLRIIDHPNYSPRIIQWMCDIDRHKDCPPAEYPSRFISVLDHPIQLWKHAYDRHISAAARCVLLVLASARSAMRLEDVQEAFNALARIYASRYATAFGADAFTHALKELEGSFIRIERRDSSAIIGFNNPSILDFLEAHLAENADGIRDLCESAVFYDQFVGLCLLRGDKPEHEHIASVLGKEPLLVQSTLMRTVQRPLQRLLIRRDLRGRVSVDVFAWRSVDDNISHAFRTLGHLDKDLAQSTADKLLGLVRDRLRNDVANLLEIPEVLRGARRIGCDDGVVAAVLADMVDALRRGTADMDSVDDYYLLYDLDDATEGGLPQDLVEFAMSRLEADSELIFDYEISSADDPIQLEDLGEKAERLSNHFHINLGVVTARILERAEDWASRIPDYPDDKPEEPPSSTGDLTDDDIVDMFETLGKR